MKPEPATKQAKTISKILAKTISKILVLKKISWVDIFTFFSEIIVIVLGILASEYIDGKFEDRHHNQEVKEFLMDLKSDLNDDIHAIDMAYTILKDNSAIYDIAIKDTLLKNLKMDSLKNTSMNISRIILILQKGNYEGFKASGKLGYLENKELKQKILSYYEEELPILAELTLFYNNQMDKIQEEEYIQKGNLNIFKINFTKDEISNRFYVCFNLNQRNLIYYKNGLSQAKSILDEINKELKD